MSLVPCKFFASNSCRFGDSCRYYHARTGTINNAPHAGNVFGGGRPYGSTQFNTAGNQQQEILNLSAKSQHNMDAIIEMVRKDMQEWELGNIWPFSSYGPTGCKPSVPGFEDISTEELRYQFLQNNRMPIDLSQELRNAQQLRLTYQQPNPVTRNIIERIVVKGEKVSTNAPTSSWGSNPSTVAPQTSGGIFGGGSAFGNIPSATGFGTSPSVFQQSIPNLFSGNNSNTNSIFGSGNQTTGQRAMGMGEGVESMDGSQPQQMGSSIFGAQPQQQNSSGLFSGQSGFQSPQQSLFGQQPQSFQPSQQINPTNLFQTQPQQNLFQPAQPSSVQPQPSLFSAPQPQPMAPLLMQPSTNGIVPTGNIFGGTFSQNQQAPTIPTPVQSIFGAPQSQSSPGQNLWAGGMQQIQQKPPNSFSSPSVVQTTTAQTLSQDQKFVYSEESELTNEDVEAFKADSFTLENIPIRPPPKAYCIM